MSIIYLNKKVLLLLLISQFLLVVLCNVKNRSKLTMVSKYLGKEPIFVAGGSNGVGLELIKQLSALGTPVKALVRNEAALANLNNLPGVTAILGDALKEADVQSAMNGCIAAVTTLGGRPSVDGQRVDYIGNSNVIEQAGILGVERIVLVTSIGCGNTAKALSPQVYRVLEDAINAKNKAERDLRLYTNLDWTIIRPGGLKSDQPTGKAVLTEDPLASGVINRGDVANLIIKVLGAASACTRKEFSAVDPSIESEFNSLTAVKPYIF
mmetsp:Transcript_23018/g.20908  ORF Transcript_23018/g.20908 Transcript_23018/m.20908 type:complete len:267 (+) Transcript_23018:71-871(+)